MATINDVAKMVGVSATTVSKVINGKGSISAKTTEQVKDAIARLGYSPSSVARALVMKKTNIIGVVLERLSDPFFYDLINSIEKGIAGTQYKLMFCNSNGDPDKRREYIRFLTQGGVDGIIVYGSYISDESAIAKAAAMGFPLVVIENELNRCDVNNLIIDNVNGAAKAVHYLVENGHRKIAHIVGKPEIKIAHDRFHGYLQAMKECQCEIANDYIVQSQMNYASGYEAMIHLMELPDRPTAVFCADDATACGAIDAVLDRKLRVPEDISIVGFDDQKILPTMYRSFIALTTIRQPLLSIGEKSVKMLIESIAHPEKAKIQEKYQCDLVVRESSCRCF